MPVKNSSGFLSRLLGLTVAPSPSTAAGESEAGSLLAIEPPMVPRWRTWGSPMPSARTARAGMALFTSAERATVACGVMAPMVTPEPSTLMPLSRSEEHTSELQSLMRNSYAVFCLKKQKKSQNQKLSYNNHG